MSKGHRTIEIVSSFPAKQRMLQEDNPNANWIFTHYRHRVLCHHAKPNHCDVNQRAIVINERFALSKGKGESNRDSYFRKTILPPHVSSTCSVISRFHKQVAVYNSYGPRIRDSPLSSELEMRPRINQSLTRISLSPFPFLCPLKFP